MLLHPFRVENLQATHVPLLSELAASYGQPWTSGLLGTWFGDGPQARVYGAGQERPHWVTASLPGLCTALHAKGGAGEVIAQRLLDLTWDWLGKDIRYQALAQWRPGW